MLLSLYSVQLKHKSRHSSPAMSEVSSGKTPADVQYQRLKARALAMQREKDAELQRELAAKAKREAQAAKEEQEVSAAQNEVWSF